jgi:hypothetical protein
LFIAIAEVKEEIEDNLSNIGLLVEMVDNSGAKYCLSTSWNPI